MKRKIRTNPVAHTATAIILAGVTSMTTVSTSAQLAPRSQSTVMNSIPNAKIPVLRLVKSIDLSHIGSAVAIRKLSFSPDSRYLGIVVDPELGKTDIVVWDMEKEKPQSHIHCPYQYGILADHDLLWSPDGKVISFGAKRQWNSMTGESLQDNPAIGRAARLNQDGTRMLTIVGAIGQPSYIHVYDTSTWARQEIYLDGFAAVSAAWTAEDKIVVGTSLTHELYSKVIDGYQPQRPEDVAIRLIDPAGKQPTKTKWFLAKPSGNPKDPFEYGFPPGGVGIPNFKVNKIFSPKGVVIDGKTLDVTRVKYFDQRTSEMAISPDGMFVFLKGMSFKYGGHSSLENIVVNTSSGTSVAQFGRIPDGGDGFALDPMGSSLALGLTSSVEIYHIQ